jgi:drug/metabolite transporter (DMT)-like permease
VARYGLGNGLLALNMIAYAIYLVLVRPLTRAHPPVLVIAWVFVASLIWLPALLLRDWAWADSAQSFGDWALPPEADSEQLWSLLYILLFPTFFAYLLNAFALSRVKASTTAIYIYLQPLITAGAAAWMLGEHLSETALIAALCIFPGVWLVSRRWSKEAP